MTTKIIVAIACLLCPFSRLPGKDRKDIPLAPLPALIINAKKIFIVNGGGSNLAYDTFYSAMKKWGRYELIGSPDNADLVVQLSYGVESGGVLVWTNPATKRANSSEVHYPKISLVIYDPKSKTPLWSTVDYPRTAVRQKNGEKEIIKSAERVVNQLRTRIDITR